MTALKRRYVHCNLGLHSCHTHPMWLLPSIHGSSEKVKWILAAGTPSDKSPKCEPRAWRSTRQTGLPRVPEAARRSFLDRRRQCEHCPLQTPDSRILSAGLVRRQKFASGYSRNAAQVAPQLRMPGAPNSAGAAEDCDTTAQPLPN